MLSLRDKFVSNIWFLASKAWNKQISTLYSNFIVRHILYVLHYFVCILTSNDRSLNVDLKSKPIIFHAIGIIVGSNTTIGRNVILRSQVCLGEKFKDSGKGPTIGDNVEFGIASKVFGDVFIKSNSKIKSNCVIS